MSSNGTRCFDDINSELYIGRAERYRVELVRHDVIVQDLFPVLGNGSLFVPDEPMDISTFFIG